MALPEVATKARRGRPAQQKPLLLAMSERYGIDEKQLFSIVKKTLIPPKKVRVQGQADVYKDASDEEIIGFLAVANRYGLDPFTKEIGAFVARNGAVVPFVMIDGWIRVVNDQPRYAGFEQTEHLDERKNLYATTTKMFVKDGDLPSKVRTVEKTEWLHECKRDTDPWKMEHRMLGHKSFMQCARYAFGLSGLMDQDEALDTVFRIEREEAGLDPVVPVPLSVKEVEGPKSEPPPPENPEAEKKAPPPPPPEAKATVKAPVGSPKPPPGETPKTDDEKRAFVLEVATAMAKYVMGTVEDQLFEMSKFSPPDKPGTFVGVRAIDDPRLKGRWLNKVYGTAKDLKRELGESDGGEENVGDPNAVGE